MNEIDRRTIDELRARYDLEPALRDVYVEGVFDKEVLTLCFRSIGELQRIVYEIEGIEIAEELVKSHGLTDGNKQRVITLARELAIGRENPAYRCLVDKDLDHWFGPLEQVPGLVWTEHSSIELYFYNDRLLQDLLLTAARARIENWDVFIDSITKILRDLFAMRLADRELKWSMKWLPLEKHLSIRGGSVVFSSSEYMRRLLMKNGFNSKGAQFSSSFSKWQIKLSGDPRGYIRGHDFIDLLAWSIRAFRGIRELASSVAIERIFLLSAPAASGLLELLP